MAQAVVPVPALTYPLRASANNRYLVDAANAPVALNGDAAWSAIVNLTPAQMEQYLEARRQQGFNAVYVNLIEHAFSNQRPKWRHVSGADPFSRTLPNGLLDLTAPNETYWQLADRFLQLANQKNMLVFAFPAYVGFAHGEDGWSREMLANGEANCQAYGAFLGNRYRNQPNLVWVAGGDWGPVEGTSNVSLVVGAIKAGIRANDRQHLWTGHSFLDSGTSGWGYLGLDLNTSYDNFFGTMAGTLQRDYLSKPTLPLVFLEGRYEDENQATQLELRSQAYYALLGGAFGHFFGNKLVWQFSPGWPQVLSSPGAQAMVHVGDLQRSRPFYRLQPDYAASPSNSLVRDDQSDFGRPFIASALADDGNLGMVYVPDGRAVSVATGRFAGDALRGWWFNPRTGAASDLGTFSKPGRRNFKAPDDQDWVLVLDNASLNLPPPGTPKPDPNPPTPPAPVACAGNSTLLREVWNNRQGNVINPNVFNTPADVTSVFSTPFVEGASNVGNNFQARYRGLLCAPVSGNYTLLVAGDDNTELYLSTDNTAANARRVAYVTDNTNYRDWYATPAQRSTSIALVAGQPYYLEIRQKQGIGINHTSVGWLLPNGSSELPIPGSRVSAIAYVAPPVPPVPGGCTGNGTLWRETWRNLPGTVLRPDLFNTAPTEAAVYAASTLEGPVNEGNSYQSRYRGYLCAPVTGDYFFTLAGDDNSELWVSIDENPANVQRVAYVGDYTNLRQWDKYASQRSWAYYTTAGQRHYIEIRHKQGEGGGHLSVGWQLPDGTLEQPINGSRVTTYVPSAARGSQAIPVVVAGADALVFPNPVAGEGAQVQLTGFAGQPTTLAVVDALGRVVTSQTVPVDRPSALVNLPVAALLPGVYTLRITGGSTTLVRRLVRAR